MVLEKLVIYFGGNKMSQTYLLLIALLSGMGIGILIQMATFTREVLKDPDKFEQDAARLVATAREFNIRRGKK